MEVTDGDQGMNMAGYNKLVPEIVQSSIWNETAETRIVWITLLATKDMTGYVRGNAMTIARMANVTQEDAQKALDIFQQPDPSSHTPDNEGRRIAPQDGGWLVLNSDLYRETGMSEANKEYWRVKKAEQRATKNKTLTDTERSKTCLGQFDAFWIAYPRKTGKKAAERVWVKEKPDLDKCLTALEWQKKDKQWQDKSYIPHPATWLNRGSWDDEVCTVNKQRLGTANGAVI
jgi:hypothetical protein